MNDASLFPQSVAPLEYERELWNTGIRHVAGVDEAGRGALAGPVVAAAIIANNSCVPLLYEVKDSKKLSAEKRNTLLPRILELVTAVGVGIVSVDEIDRINILQASLLAMKKAVDALCVRPELCLIDGNMKAPIEIAQRTIIKGDDRIFSIAAASIVAKVTRDRLMSELSVSFPQYGFGDHKGYGTESHLSAIREFGPSSHHRMSFHLPKGP